MSAEAQTSAPNTDPDPPRAAPDMPSGLGRVLRLVRKLIDYGRQLAATAQQHASAPDFAVFARRFGTPDVPAILARITAGLRRAAALEAKLSQRATRGRELTPSSTPVPSSRPPRVAHKAAPPHAQPASTAARAEDPYLARLPTEAEIAAELRRRPIGAVIVEICHDLGIAPGHLDRAFWDEINHAILMYGGSLARFCSNTSKRQLAFGFGEHYALPNPAWLPAPPRLPIRATGPP
jgi:hypothetical protein